MKILITGALGYIGSALMPYLKQKGYSVTGYDIGFFEECIIRAVDNENIIFKDMRDFSDNDIDGYSAVVHLAGISNDPVKNLTLSRIYDPTRIYTIKLAKACKKKGIKFVFASSCSIYGRAGSKIVDENSEPKPQTPYSLNKLQIEQDLTKISDTNFCPIILRFATIFGMSPRIRFDLYINMFIGMALTSKKIILNSDGNACRPNVHIDDICKAIEFAINFKNKKSKPVIVNVGSTNQNFQIIQVAKLIQKEVEGCRLNYLSYKKITEEEELIKDRKIINGVDNRSYKVSFEMIKEIFSGFKCDIEVESGIKMLIKDLRNIGLTKEQFKNKNYYRLQKFEMLYENGLITNDLRLIKGGKK